MGLEPTTTGITIRGSTNWATVTLVDAHFTEKSAGNQAFFYYASQVNLL